jgi:sarcosine oxidase
MLHMKVIVLGLGIMGSATAYTLSRRGHQVIALDANERGHQLGSSHGKTRITRQAYFEAPEYVPLLKRSYELFRELESETGKTLLTECGGLFIGDDPNTNLVESCKRSADIHSIAYEIMTGAQINKRFPCFALPESYYGLFEPTAGFLHAHECLNAYYQRASELGAVLHFEEPAITWSATKGGVRVKTPIAEYSGDALVVTAGPWAPRLLSSLELPLHPLRVFFSYFQTPHPEKFTPDKCPIYCISEQGVFHYGFPYEPGGGMKIAHHGSARFSVQQTGNQICTPESCDRTVHPHEVEALREKLNGYLPGAGGEHASSTVCLYTMTPDENFIIDRDDTSSNVVYGCGFSGHGFKMGSVVGEVLADMVTTGSTRHSIDFLSARRFATQSV